MTVDGVHHRQPGGFALVGAVRGAVVPVAARVDPVEHAVSTLQQLSRVGDRALCVAGTLGSDVGHGAQR